ncbi:MAG: choice-of-anchor D domain-containing protein [Chloroflexia bacterium]
MKAGTLTIGNSAAGTPQTVSLTGTGITANLSITPSSLDFGYVQVGVTTAAKTVTVKNIGSGPVTISNASITAGATDYTIVANTCFTAGNGATLPPGGTCTISVVFTPQAAGTRPGTLTITDTASGTPQTVSLTGIGITANISVAPSALDFGYQQVGTTSASQTITVTNIGSGPVTISNVVKSGGAMGNQFNIVGNTCFSAGNGATLPPGGTCTITVTFSPNSVGLKEATITITDNASGSAQVVSLQGTGITAQLSITPASLDFGVVQVNSTTPAKTVTVTNVGSGPVSFSLAGLAGADATQFEIVADTCFSAGNPATLPPGASCTISVRFIPTTVGYKSALLTITDTASGTPQTVSLTGVAVTQALSVSPASLHFGPQQINMTSPAQSVTITNTTNAPVTIGPIATLPNPPFIVVDNNCSGTTLGPNATCTFSVVFNSATAGTFNGLVLIQSNLPAPATLTTVALTGIATNPSMEITPASLDFGNEQVGSVSPAQTVTIKNTGYGPLTINTATLIGLNFIDFQIVDDGCSGQVIPAGQTCQISVRFRPFTPGAKSAQLSVTSDAATSPQTVGLTGVGITPGLIFTPVAINFGNQQLNTTATQSILVQNSTGGPVTIFNVVVSGSPAFSLTANTCIGATLPAGGFCVVGVNFRPTTLGAHTGQVTFTDTAAGSPHIVTLSGQGLGAPTPVVGIDYPSLDFGPQQVGTTSPAKTITITNNGDAALVIASAVITTGGANFTKIADTCSGQTLNPGVSCTLSVVFNPTTTGPLGGVITLTDNAPSGGSTQTISLTGIGITAQVSVVPASLDFGNVQVGAVSPAQTVTVTNVGAGPVSLSTIALGGTNAADFEVLDNTCTSGAGAATLPAGGSCTVSVRFKPGSTGAKSATLSIGDSASGTPQVVGLSGVGISSAVGLTPASLDFGNQQVGTTSPAKTVTLTNTSNGPLSITSVVSSSAEFQVVGNTCGSQTIAPNATCTVSVVFSPTSAGAKTATLTIADSTNTGNHIVSLTGTGITGGLRFDPVAINFGQQQVLTTATQSIVVTNISSGPVTISAVTLGLGTNSAFTLTGNTCVGATLPAGGSCVVGVNFTPTTTGLLNGSVVFTDTAAGSPHTVTLSGQGTASPTPVVEITPASLDFGNQQVGTTSPAKTVTLKNNGTAALTISSVAITVGGADFTKVADTCAGQVVNPGQSCTISVVFNPTTGGPRAGLLTITDNVPSAGSIQTVSLTGTGVTGALTVSPTALDFGNIQVGSTSAVQSLTIQNTGAATFTINSVSVNSSDFLITGSSCAGVTLAAGEICQIGVVFKPASAGPKSATLTIDHTAPGSPTTVSLTGVGISAAISLAPPSLDFGPQQLNTSSPAQTVTIRNVSNGPLQISTITSNSAEFQVFANTCASQTIAPNATCTVSVVFRPTVAGQRTGTLTIADNTATGSHTVSLTGMGVTSAVTLSGANFQFGSQQVGTTSPAQTLTVRNTGENTLTISSVAITGTHAGDFIKSGDTCLGATLAPGQECQVSVSFSPTAGGSRTASLVITDSAPGSPRTVVLGGVGITPLVTFSPLSLDFGQVAVGATSAAQTVTLTNTSDGPLTISSVGSSNAAFHVGADTCTGATLPAGSSCQVSVTFRPTATGQQTGSLVFNTTVGSGQQSISLTGLGVAAATPTIGLSATTLSFGAQQVGTQSITQMLTLTNTGNVPVTISAVVLNGTNSSDFVLYGNSCVGATIAAGGTCQIGVAFKPTAAGTRTSTLRIEDSAAGSPRSVALLGIGTIPTLSISAPSLEFGSIQVGAISAPQTVTVTNNSTGAVTISGIAVNGLNASDYTKTLDTCIAMALAPGSSCSITMRFSPTAGGARTGGLTLTISNGSPLTIGLNGLGVTAQVSFDPAAINFGSQPLTTMSNFQTVRLTNGGTGALSITAVSLTGGDVTDFVIAGDTCAGSTLGPNGSCQVTVAFRPTATGNRFVNLTFSTNVGNGTQTVPLQGVGTTTPTPAIQLSVQGLTFDAQQVGTQSGIQSVTVTNTGTANLSITTVSITGINSTDFVKTGDNCAGTSLAPGASCSLGVRFAPTAAGNRGATLTFATNAGTGLQTISLVGIGVTPTVLLNSTSFSFGQQPVGVPSAGKTLELTNVGNGALVISTVTLAGVNAGDFIKNGDTCSGATLAPGLSCTVGVIFRPLTVGNKTATLLINDNAPGAPRDIVLTGEGIQNVTPSVNISANSLNFGTIQVGSVSTGQSLIVANTGNAPLHVTAVIVSGTNSNDFWKSGDTCANATIAPQNFCSIGIIFRPTAAGVRIATLVLVDDAAGSPREITLTGVGLTGALTLSAASLNFGEWTISTPEKPRQASPTQILTVTNTGQGALTLGAVAVTGPNAGDWILLANTCVNATVPAGSNCQIGVAFKPTALGDRSATLTIANTAAGSVHNVALLGTGVPPKPSYNVTLNVSSLGCNGTITPPSTLPDGSYEADSKVTLQVNVGSSFVFLGWRINTLAAGWANPLTLTVTRDMEVEAVCVPKDPSPTPRPPVPAGDLRRRPRAASSRLRRRTLRPE